MSDVEAQLVVRNQAGTAALIFESDALSYDPSLLLLLPTPRPAGLSSNLSSPNTASLSVHLPAVSRPIPLIHGVLEVVESRAELAGILPGSVHTQKLKIARLSARPL